MRPDLLVRHYLFGVLMGAADVVPGVSGGTMALIVGIYARLIESISNAVRALPRAVRGGPRAGIESLRLVEWTLVVPLGVGIVTAILVGSAFIPDLLDDHPVQMRAIFFGLIAASVFLPWRRIGAHTPRTAAILVAGAVAAFIFSGLPDTTASDPSMVAVFFAASLAICAMILPGVSGSFLLLVMGMYEPTLDAVHDRDLVYVAVFLAGALVGISFFSTLLRWLLAHAHDLTMAALVGLMVGSLRALWPFLEEDRGLRMPEDGEPVALAVVLALGAFVVILGLTRLGDRLEAAAEHEAMEIRR